jgi:hypothetical protein
MVLLTLFATGVASAQEYSVKVSAVEKAITFDLSNTDWFAKDGAPNTSSLGVTLYNFDSAGTFDSFMRVNTDFDIDTMFSAESHYGFTYGATMNLGEKLYAIGGLGFTSDFAHTESLVGTATYGIMYTNKKVALGVSEDSAAGVTVSLGGKF